MGRPGPPRTKATSPETSPYGHAEQAFDICELSRAAGATFVARGTAYSYMKLVGLIAAGISHKGFSLVEVVSACPTFYGRFDETPTPAEMLLGQKRRAVPAERYEAGTASHADKYPVGILHHAERTEYLDAYAEVQRRAQSR